MPCHTVLIIWHQCHIIKNEKLLNPCIISNTFKGTVHINFAPVTCGCSTSVFYLLRNVFVSVLQYCSPDIRVITAQVEYVGLLYSLRLAYVTLFVGKPFKQALKWLQDSISSHISSPVECTQHLPCNPFLDHMWCMYLPQRMEGIPPQNLVNLSWNDPIQSQYPPPS